ncbi:MAG TPA: PQQ-dependent sugar dehydrogenase [Jatrophihabitans sp.]|nr:PQQ-dependent sugar dehydrogenase [Jatrophihabitans sp.]
MIRLQRAGSRPVLALATVLLLGGLLAGCNDGTDGSSQSWVPQPDFQGNNEPAPQLPNPGIATPSLPGTGPQPSQPGGGTQPSPRQSGQPADPNVVATGLVEPTGLVVLPDGTALVGERKTGRIYRVQPDGHGHPALVQTLAGVDGSGDGGLLDLAISPTYAEDGLIYAYLTTRTDNRVVHFPLGSAPSVVIGGIPRGTTGNTGRIAFDATGALLTGTGDAGNPVLAASLTGLAGKLLRTDDIGKPAPDNPTAGSPIYARGVAGLTGLCVDQQSGLRVAVTADRVSVIRAGGDYTGAVGGRALPAGVTGGGGCALAGGQLVVATSTGKALAVATVGKDGTVGTFTASLTGVYGRLRTAVAGSDSALWLTTRNRDGLGKPTADDDRVIRITNPDSTSPVV